jgi:hypothetical protein
LLQERTLQLSVSLEVPRVMVAMIETGCSDISEQEIRGNLNDERTLWTYLAHNGLARVL